MASRITFALKYRNMVHLIHEWHYSDVVPEYYYHYSLRSEKYKFLYKGKGFLMYEKVITENSEMLARRTSYY